LRIHSRENEKCGSEITEFFRASTKKNIKNSFFLYTIAERYTEPNKHHR
jgi:hypothetical protein